MINFNKIHMVGGYAGALPQIIVCLHDSATKSWAGHKRNFRDTKKIARLSCEKNLSWNRRSSSNIYGESSYVIIADFSRNCIDANRKEPIIIAPQKDEKCGYDATKADISRDEYLMVLISIMFSEG
jgi:hypothetical protein